MDPVTLLALLARVAGAVLLPWAALGLRRGWALALILALPLAATGAAVLLPAAPAATRAAASLPAGLLSLLLHEGAVGLVLGLVASLPLVALLVAGRLAGQALGARTAAMALPVGAAGERRSARLDGALLLLAPGLLLAAGGHRPLLGAWMAGASGLPPSATAGSGSVPLAGLAEPMAVALGDMLQAGIALALPFLALAAIAVVLAGVLRRVLGRLAWPGVAPGSLAAPLLLLALGLWIALALPGVPPLFARALQGIGWVLGVTAGF